MSELYRLHAADGRELAAHRNGWRLHDIAMELLTKKAHRELAIVAPNGERTPYVRRAREGAR